MKAEEYSVMFDQIEIFYQLFEIVVVVLVFVQLEGLSVYRPDVLVE